MARATSLLVAATAATALARTWNKPVTFRPDGTFKVIGVSDSHFTHNTRCTDLSASQQQYPCSDANTTAFLRAVVAAEDPDLVVFTGDNTCGGDPQGGADGISGLLADFLLPNATVPWIAVEGNHDGESGLNYQQMAAYLLTLPNSLQEVNCPGFANISGGGCYGNTNFVVTIPGPQGSPLNATTLATLYFLDSNSYSTLPAVQGYGWVHLDQVNYYNAVSGAIAAEAAAQNRSGPPPALAFQHIPLPEHQYLLTADVPITGQYHEGVCCPLINTGLHAAMVSAGDVKAVTVGHDHTNDYCGEWQSIYMCYDGHSGYGASGYGEPDWPIRSRVWYFSAWGASIQTWKHLDTQCGGCTVNSSVIDVQTIYSNLPVAALASSQTSGSPDCPAGYAPLPNDLNKDAGGSYSYVCVERATTASTAYVVNVTVAIGTAGSPPQCPPASEGWVQVPGNLKAGTQSAAVMNLCYQTAPLPNITITGSSSSAFTVVTDVQIAQGGATSPVACNAGYVVASPDLSGGVGEFENLCAAFATWSEEMAGNVAANMPHHKHARVPAHGTWSWSAALRADKAARHVPSSRRKAAVSGAAVEVSAHDSL